MHVHYDNKGYEKGNLFFEYINNNRNKFHTF